MNSERDLRRYAARRASLSVALREGHVGAAARAASRLRVDGFRIPREEFARARAVRRTLGLALVNARIARPAVVASRATPVVARGRPWRALVAVLAAAAALLLVLLFAPNDQARGGGSAPPALPAETQRALTVVTSRGRTISLVPEVVAVEETPTPMPTALPTTTPPPAATTGGAGSGGGASGGAGSGPPGSGSGSGGGVAPPTRPPTPAPTATPPVPPAGFTRLNVIVYDSTTSKPLEGVCVVIGTIDCGPDAPHTNALGRWSADVAASSASTKWDLMFLKVGYLVQTRQITLPGGVSRTYVIFLVPHKTSAAPPANDITA